MADKSNQGGKGVWPSFETASRLYDVANFALIASLVVGVAATVLLVWMGNVKEGYLRRDVASAGERAATANERAAILEKENLATKLQYERLKAAVSWRTIEPRDLELLTRHLATRPSVVQLEYVQGDPESQNLAAYLRAAFMQAKWTVMLKDRVYPGGADGIWVLPNATPSDSTSLSVSNVRGAFASIGLIFESKGEPVTARIGDTWGPNSPPVRVIVGVKPKPTLP